MVIPLRVQCSKDFVCNRRQHSSRSQRASLSLGIRFEADNVIVLRGESPQSSLGRACRLQLIFIWCLGNEGQGVVKVRQHTNMHTNNIMARMESSSSQKVRLQLYGCPPPLLSAAFPARRAMKRASRQILTALPPSASLSLSLSSAAYWRKAHGCGQRACCRRLVSCGCSSDRGRPDEPFW